MPDAPDRLPPPHPQPHAAASRGVGRQLVGAHGAAGPAAGAGRRGELEGAQAGDDEIAMRRHALHPHVGERRRAADLVQQLLGFAIGTFGLKPFGVGDQLAQALHIGGEPGEAVGGVLVGLGVKVPAHLAAALELGVAAMLVGQTEGLPETLTSLSTTGILKPMELLMVERWIDSASAAGLIVPSADQYHTLTLTPLGRDVMAGRITDVRLNVREFPVLGTVTLRDGDTGELL